MLNINCQNNSIEKEIINVINPAVLSDVKVNVNLNNNSGFIINNIFSINNISYSEVSQWH